MFMFAACSESTAPSVTPPPVVGGIAPIASVVVTLTSPGGGPPVPSGATVNLQAIFQLTATTKDANGNVLTGHVVTYASSNTAVAAISETGVLICVGSGSATITASSEGVSGRIEIAVADLSWLG
jgi:hypothetical protein